MLWYDCINLRSNIYSNSFFPSCTRLWNSLPPNVSAISTLPTFKRAIVNLVDCTVVESYPVSILVNSAAIYSLQVYWSVITNGQYPPLCLVLLAAVLLYLILPIREAVLNGTKLKTTVQWLVHSTSLPNSQRSHFVRNAYSQLHLTTDFPSLPVGLFLGLPCPLVALSEAEVNVW